MLILLDSQLDQLRPRAETALEGTMRVPSYKQLVYWHGTARCRKVVRSWIPMSICLLTKELFYIFWCYQDQKIIWEQSFLDISLTIVPRPSMQQELMHYLGISLGGTNNSPIWQCHQRSFLMKTSWGIIVHSSLTSYALETRTNEQTIKKINKSS